MLASAEDVARALDDRAKPGSNGWWELRCPCHDDKHASLGVKTGDRALVVSCQAGCDPRAVLEVVKSRGFKVGSSKEGAGNYIPMAIRPPKPPKPPRVYPEGAPWAKGHELIARHPYKNEQGETVHEVLKFRTQEGKKTFRQQAPVDGGWVRSLAGIDRIMYRLPELRKAIKAGEPVYIVEGEKDADNLAKLGLAATTSSQGAAAKRQKSELACLVGAKKVVILPDGDKPGREYGQQWKRSLLPVIPAVQVVELYPGENDGRDASDWIAAGGDREQLESLTNAAQEPIGAANDEPREFIRGDNGRIVHKAIENIEIALERLKVKLWYDQFADRTMCQVGEGLPRSLEDHDMDRWWIATDQEYQFRPAQTLWRTVVLDIARQATAHPVRDYLESLEWDGKPRVDRWLIDYAEAEDSEYLRAVSSIVLIAAVRRVRDPGCKFDEMLVLESTQGGAKSSALAALCPNDEWFTDDLPLGCDSRQVIERTAGCWIVEAAELSGMKKSEVELVKAFLSRRSDKARMAYARLPVDRPRHFICIGTTNSKQYLRDTTGNRRFWPVAVSDFDLEGIEAARDQLWAEAATREAAGESIRLPFSLWAEAGKHQEARRMVDSWEEVLDSAIGAFEGLVATDDVWRIVGHGDPERRGQADNWRIADIMARLGFTRVRKTRSGRRVYAYQRGEALDWLEVESRYQDSRSWDEHN